MEFNYVLDLDDTLVNTTKDMGGDNSKARQVTLVKGASEFLSLHGKRTSILSAGVVTLQDQKIDALYLRKLVKCIIVVSSPERKLQWLSTHVAAKKMAGERVIVVGDRLDHEIQMGNRLDCITVRMRLRGAKYSYNEPQTALQYPNFTVQDFEELLKLKFDL